MTFQQGDIVRVSTKPEHDLPDVNHDLPEEWDAIVVSVDEEEIEVAWLSRFVTPKNPRLSPMRETWDDSTVTIQPGGDAHVTVLKRATYTDAIG